MISPSSSMGGCADTSSIDNSLAANTSQLDKAAQEALSFITFHICSQKTSLKVQTLKGKSKSSKARYNDNLNNVIDIVGGKEFICIKMVVVVGPFSTCGDGVSGSGGVVGLLLLLSPSIMQVMVMWVMAALECLGCQHEWSR